jgi:MFS superfamily sulfate permease-like transporter
MNDSSGGRTRVAGLVAAAAVALVLMFLTGPLRFVPVAALGAVLIIAALSLLDLRSLRHFWTISKTEFMISLIATACVIRFGAIKAILFVVALSLVRFVRVIARPRAEVLGAIPGIPGFHSLDRHRDAVLTPGLVLFRFNGPVVFFNADYFKREVLAAAAREGGQLRWFAIDMIPITQFDVTGLDAITELEAELARRGAVLVLAGRRAETAQYFESRNLSRVVPADRHFTTIRKVLQAYCAAFDLADTASAGGQDAAVDVDAALDDDNNERISDR